MLVYCYECLSGTGAESGCEGGSVGGGIFVCGFFVVRVVSECHSDVCCVADRHCIVWLYTHRWCWLVIVCFVGMVVDSWWHLRSWWWW